MSMFIQQIAKLVVGWLPAGTATYVGGLGMIVAGGYMLADANPDNDSQGTALVAMGFTAIAGRRALESK